MIISTVYRDGEVISDYFNSTPDQINNRMDLTEADFANFPW